MSYVSILPGLSKLLWLFSVGTLAYFHIFKTDSDRCNDMTYSCPVYGSETNIIPTSLFGVCLP